MSDREAFEAMMKTYSGDAVSLAHDGIERADQKAALLEFKMRCLEASERGKRLAEREAERKHMEIKEAELKRMMLLDRLKAAHEHAQQIPDLEKELREVLAGMGYTFGKLSPFVEPEDYAAAIAERKQAVKTKKANMSDWRNWLPGDILKDSAGRYFTYHGEIKQRRYNGDHISVTDRRWPFRQYSEWPAHFSFHSRPAKGEK